MSKTIRTISIDPDLNDLIKVRSFEDKEFSVSKLINEFLRDFFKADIGSLNKKKLLMRKSEAEKELALVNSQLQAAETEKKKVEEKEYSDMGIKPIGRVDWDDLA